MLGQFSAVSYTHNLARLYIGAEVERGEYTLKAEMLLVLGCIESERGAQR